MQENSTPRRLKPSAGVRMLALLQSFAAARRGSIAVVFAVALPMIAVGSVMGVQLYYVYSVKSQTQDAADNAAQWGAEQLTITPSGATSRTQQWAQAQLGSLPGSATTTITATQIDSQTMKVAIDSNLPSFFGNLLPAGGFNVHSEATAVGAALTPLCVLVTAPSSVAGANMHLTATSQMQSTCLVQSDSTLTVDAAANLTAGAIDTVSTATGTMTPTANTGSPSRPDPFSSLNTAPPSTCSTLTAAQNLVGNILLAPGTYCYPINVPGGITVTLSGGTYVFGGGVNVSGGSTLNLNSGQFYFGGTLTVSGNSVLNGSDAVLDFYQATAASGPAPAAPTMNLSGQASVSLSGRQSGSLAGFVLIVDSSLTGNFQVQSDFISKMTGTVYSPAATLTINGTKKAIQASDWTVIDASSLQLTGSPDVVINSNYSGSSVPVPTGVGNNSGQTRLTQ